MRGVFTNTARIWQFQPVELKCGTSCPYHWQCVNSSSLYWHTDMATKHPNAAGNPGKGATELQEKPAKTKPPAMWQVLMYNDDYTPMEFVVDILTRIFGHSSERATQIMLQVHTEGRGICGIFPRDLASMKVEQVLDLARKFEHPLRCSMEEV